MTWVRLDDRFAEHPKVVGLSDAAFRLHVNALCYAARNLTDGHIPVGAIRALRGQRRTVVALITAGCWEECDDGWAIHDYLGYNPSAEAVNNGRRAAKERMQRLRSPDVRR